VWVGVFDRYPLAIAQTRDKVMYAFLEGHKNHDEFITFFHSYLQLDVKISTLYSEVCLINLMVAFSTPFTACNSGVQIVFV
jgi:hypothetical protein